MLLNDLYIALAEVLNGDLKIERLGCEALLEAARNDIHSVGKSPLPKPYLDAFEEPDAHPACKLVAEAEFDWAPPATIDDPVYVEHSVPKAHIELIGPDGIVTSDRIRMGLYGMLPGHEYGIRTHLAEEVFVMIAGEADWKRGHDQEYGPLRAGDRSYHPSMTPHANRTRDSAFMSVFVWVGDVSTESYVYEGRD